MGTNLEKPQETGRYNGNPYGSFYCWSPHVMGTRSSAKNTGRYNGNQREPAKDRNRGNTNIMGTSPESSNGNANSSARKIWKQNRTYNIKIVLQWFYRSSGGWLS